MAKRGRPQQPPRTDPGEIARSRADLDKEIDRRTVTVLGPMPEPEELSPEERLKRIEHLLKPPPVLTDEEREARLAEWRARVAAEEIAAARKRPRKKKPDFKTQATRILPLFPQWIRDAAFDSILFLYDEAPESLRPKIEDIDPKLEKIRELLTGPGLLSRWKKKGAAIWDMVRCAAWAQGTIRDPGPNGHRAAFIHYINVEDKMRMFAATCEIAPDGRVKIPRNVVLRLFAPAFNAIHPARRVCLECGTVFALRNDHERMNMKFCGDAKKCGKKVSSRKAKAAARAAGDAYTKVRETEKGDLPLECAGLEVAGRTDVEDILLGLIDASRRVRGQK